MKSEDGTGSRHPSWRCGNVTPPISFVNKVVTSAATFNIFQCIEYIIDGTYSGVLRARGLFIFTEVFYGFCTYEIKI